MIKTHEEECSGGLEVLRTQWTETLTRRFIRAVSSCRGLDNCQVSSFPVLRACHTHYPPRYLKALHYLASELESFGGPGLSKARLADDNVSWLFATVVSMLLAHACNIHPAGSSQSRRIPGVSTLEELVNRRSDPRVGLVWSGRRFHALPVRSPQDDNTLKFACFSGFQDSHAR